MKTDLKGDRILVTRPQLQADHLCRLIERQGGVAVRFPTLEIRSMGNEAQIKRRLDALENECWLIFISANAVNFTLKANNGKIDQLRNRRIAAVGKATARSLQDYGLTVDLLPRQGFNSEALLQADDLQALKGQHCIIVRGLGGREKLADTLRERGAVVEYLEVYQRVMPSADNKELVEMLRHGLLAAVTITSGEALQNLLAMLEDHAPLLFKVPVVVISDRIAQLAGRMGFEKIAVAASPEDAAILKTLTTL